MVTASKGGDEERAERDHGDCDQDGVPAAAGFLPVTTVPEGRTPCTP